MKKNNYLESLNTKFIQHEYINKPHESNVIPWPKNECQKIY